MTSTGLMPYWGEGHVVRSPANVRDMWQRIFEWFEQFPGECERDLPTERGQDRAGSGCIAGGLPSEPSNAVSATGLAWRPI